MPPKKRPSPQRQRKPRPKSHAKADGLIHLTLNAMAYGGHAIGSHQRRVVFVPYTIPGEQITARITRSERTVDFAEGVTIQAASADRVYPQCPHFGPGRCWGCQWQHIDYPAQLLLKQDVLADQLSRLGKFDDRTLEAAVQPVRPSPKQWHYNAHLTLERAPDGGFGLHKVDGRSIEPLTTCLVLHEELLALYNVLDIDFSAVRRLQLLRGSDGATMLTLTLTSEDAPELSADLATSINLILPDNEPVNLVGDSLVHFDVGGRRFRSTVGTYFRANLGQIEPLVNEVLAQLGLSGNDQVLELYAGVGVLSAFIAPRAQVLTVVESYPPAATDADANLGEFDHVDVVEGSVEDVLQAMLEDEAEYDLALVDSPGTGMSRSALDALMQLAPRKIVYVSGNPATLARDGQQLARNGYRLERAQPFDFSPQTYYIDTVAAFAKS